MNTKYLIENKSLADIADAIRVMDETTEPIIVAEYPDRIKQLKPTTEDYMRLSDYMKYPKAINEDNYTAEAIAETETLIQIYAEMEVDDNG